MACMLVRPSNISSGGGTMRALKTKQPNHHGTDKNTNTKREARKGERWQEE